MLLFIFRNEGTLNESQMRNQSQGKTARFWNNEEKKKKKDSLIWGSGSFSYSSMESRKLKGHEIFACICRKKKKRPWEFLPELALPAKQDHGFSRLYIKMRMRTTTLVLAAWKLRRRNQKRLS